MSPSSVCCTKCQALLADKLFNQPALQPCPACGTPIQVEIFPALFRPFTPGKAGEPIVVDGESSCFYHPQKKAAVVCVACGRFLCALCDCELGGQHLCPACLEAGQQKGKIKSLENHRTLYDSMALALAAYPLLIFYFTIITAPAALFVAIRHWNSPSSIIPRTKIRFVLAIITALMELAGWGVGVYFLIHRT